MAPIKWLNNMLFMENLLGIYRKYCTKEKKKKLIIISHVFIQTLLHTIVLIYEEYLLMGRNNFTKVKFLFGLFGLVAFLNAVSSVVTALCCSNSFMSYYRSISRVSNWFKDDDKLNTTIKKTIFIGTFFNSLFYSVISYKTSESLTVFLPKDPIRILIPVIISRSIVRYIIVFQHLVLYTVVVVVVLLFRRLTSLISGVQESVGCVSSNEKCDVKVEQIQQWVDLYRDLANCCEKVSICFGRQYFFSMFLSIAQYIVLTYNMIYSTIKHKGDIYNVARVAMIVFCYISVMMMPLIAGQMARNQAVKFHRVLVRLYNSRINVSSNAETKMIKDFIRLMKKNPLEIKILSKITVGMYMLPVILTLTVNYIIFMLQVNHII